MERIKNALARAALTLGLSKKPAEPKTLIQTPAPLVSTSSKKQEEKEYGPDRDLVGEDGVHKEESDR